MTTADIISQMTAGETATVTKTVGKGKQATTIKVTHTAPPVKVIDETVKPVEATSLLPVDAGKRTVEVLPGLQLVAYSKGYVSLRVTGRDFNGKKTTIGKPFYREELKVLIDCLLAEVENTRTYEEAHNLDAVPF